MYPGVSEIKGCEVCQGEDLTPVLNLGLHPMCDDLVSVGNERICKEYPIEILYCSNCKTAHQKFQIAKQELFPKTYHYRSRFTADVLNGMRDLVESYEKSMGSLDGKKVLDIGCNDGSLLGFFKEKGALTFGIEPTGAAQDAKDQGHVVFNGFLSEEIALEFVSAHGNPDVIVFTNVFAHIEDLKEVVRCLRTLMSPNTVIIVENHYLGAVLDKNQFDTFYHEHPRTYSFTSFIHIAKSLGVPISHLEFPARYGGNIRVFMGPASSESIESDPLYKTTLQKEALYFDSFLTMQKNIETWKNHKKKKISELCAKHGKLKAKAFPGRAAILVKLLDLDENQILATYEKPGSMKIGNYLPGTRIPIMSDAEIFHSSAEADAPILNLAWHISDEIKKYMIENGCKSQIINVIESEDFN